MSPSHKPSPLRPSSKLPAQQPPPLRKTTARQRPPPARRHSLRTALLQRAVGEDAESSSLVPELADHHEPPSSADELASEPDHRSYPSALPPNKPRHVSKRAAASVTSTTTSSSPVKKRKTKTSEIPAAEARRTPESAPDPNSADLIRQWNKRTPRTIFGDHRENLADNDEVAVSTPDSIASENPVLNARRTLAEPDLPAEPEFSAEPGYLGAAEDRRDQQTQTLVQNLRRLRGEFNRGLRAAKRQDGNRGVDADAERQAVITKVMGIPCTVTFDDAEVRRNFQILRDSVSNIVSKYFKASVLRAKLNSPSCEDVLVTMGRLSSDVKKHLEDDDQALLLLEAFLWYHLQRVIWSPSATHWAGNFGPAYFEYYRLAKVYVANEFPELLPELNELRARLAQFLFRLHGNDPFNTERAKHYAFEPPGIIALVEPQMLRAYVRDAGKIIHLAASMDKMFRTTLPDWSLQPSKLNVNWHGYEFDGKVMQVLGAGSARRPRRGKESLVALTVRPGLVRLGDADGKNYGTPVVLNKAEVLLED